MMKPDSLTHYAGLLSVPAAMAAVVVGAAVPHGAYGQTSPAQVESRPVHQSADAALSSLAHFEGDYDWLEAERLDPFADEALDDAAALELRMAAEDNLELV